MDKWPESTRILGFQAFQLFLQFYWNVLEASEYFWAFISISAFIFGSSQIKHLKDSILIGFLSTDIFGSLEEKNFIIIKIKDFYL